MNLRPLLRLGAVTFLLILVGLPLVAWKTAHSASSETLKASVATSLLTIEKPNDDIPAELTPAVLSATYSGHSGCAATNHDFDIVVDVLDAANNIYRVRNLLDEGEVIKARLREGKLQLGRQKMGFYQVTGYVQYLENPARVETHIKYEDGIGYCEDVSVFNKR
jgi:hypothetical protein